MLNFLLIFYLLHELEYQIKITDTYMQVYIQICGIGIESIGKSKT